MPPAGSSRIAVALASPSVVHAVTENAHTAADMVGDLVADMAACAAPERDVLRS
jgi:hypothetical protein